MVNITFTFDQIEYLLVLFVRIITFVSVAPFFNNTAIPNRVKIGFSVLASMIMYNVIPYERLEYTGVIGFALLVNTWW